MLISIGNAIMEDESIRQGRTDDEIKAWVKSDPKYSWVKAIEDNSLLLLLDRYFSIMDHESFLSMRLPGPPEIPTLTPDGDLNYCAVAIGAFADQWLRRLAELRAGGWDDSIVDLKQAFIISLVNNPTLQAEATTFMTTSHDLLISHMRSWCQKRENEQRSNKQRRDKAIQQAGSNGSAGAAKSNNANVTTVGGNTQNDSQGAPADHGKRQPETAVEELKRTVKALRTEIAEVRRQSGDTTARIPDRVDRRTQWYCHGCGRTYKKDGRPIPCEKTCIFCEHADHNTGYKQGVPWPVDKPPLMWGTAEEYRAKYHKELPERGKRYNNQLANRTALANKRDRNDTA
jgi:hypothetical protein